MTRNDYSDAYVCTECFDDEDLQAFIEKNQEEFDEGCSFCHATGEGVVVCRFKDLMEHVKSCIEAEYDLAVTWLSWDKGWQGAEHWDTPDLLTERIGIGLPRDDPNGSLLYAMCSFLEYQEWCYRNPYGEQPLERLQFDWNEFTNISIRHTRFFLSSYQSSHEPMLSERSSPRGFLSAIGDTASRMELCTVLPKSTELYRVRFNDGQSPFTSPSDLGPPPAQGAFVSNRMSPPGIVMFYAAMDKETALQETRKEAGEYCIGRFRTVRDLRVLDLTVIPTPAGFFAEIPDSWAWNRHEAEFFREFVDDLTKPINRDERVHLDYVPTQIIVEYFRREFHREHDAAPLQGVIYPSARNQGGVAIALFCDRSAIVGVEDDSEYGLLLRSDESKWLELTGSEVISISTES